MSRGVNKFIGIGTVGKDPEARYLPSGGAVTSLSIAINESWKDKDGQKQERVEWIQIIFFNRLAEIVNEYVRKGSKLYIEGSLRTRSWEKDGITRYATEIVAKEMQMLDSRSGGDGYQGQQSSGQGAPSAKAQSSQSGGQQSPPAGDFDDFDDFDDSIPF